MNKVPIDAGFYWVSINDSWIVVWVSAEWSNGYQAILRHGSKCHVLPEEIEEWGEKVKFPKSEPSDAYDPEWCQNPKQHFDVYG